MIRSIPFAGPGAVLLAFGALALTAPAFAQEIEPGESPAFEQLDRLLNQTGPAHGSTMVREAPCLYRHRTSQVLPGGADVETWATVDYADVDAAGAVQQPVVEGVIQLIVPLREDAAPVRYDLTLHDPRAELHQTYIDTYGATCEGASCTAVAESRDVYLTVVGDTAATDIETVSQAVTDLAAYCAARDSEGD